MNLTDDVRAVLKAKRLTVHHLIANPCTPEDPDLLLIVEGVDSSKVRETLEECPAIGRVQATSSGFVSVWGHPE